MRLGERRDSHRGGMSLPALGALRNGLKAISRPNEVPFPIDPDLDGRNPGRFGRGADRQSARIAVVALWGGAPQGIDAASGATRAWHRRRLA